MSIKIFLDNALRLSAEIMMFNPDTNPILDLYEKMLSELKTLVRKKDTEGLIALMEHHASRLWPAG